MKFKYVIGVAMLMLASVCLAASHGGPGMGQGQGTGQGMGQGPGPGMGPGKGPGMGQGLGKNKGLRGMHMLQPMPNLMRVIVKQGQQLNLSKEQEENFARWRELNHDKVHARLQQMMATRKALQVAAMKGANLAAINRYVNKMDRLRAEIIAAKVACRNNVRRVLDDEQWDKLIAIYTETYL